MRLVKLEIKGFKSFAKETVLHFGEDVIGVVGPNGSGKSNIVDAIRWVLGEQKKGELRLDKMSSVIFNGTKKRKAGNVAQVFLTFDNNRGVLRSEFQTITIGRLLFRNGDSEYRLNGVTCRRKDITDLFVDTGIESNSYAIIALGMVDDILADKDNSRLRMLEQAAGISVYKLRKKETVNRLNRTQEDLDRVDDLLHEIDGNLKDLEKQARRTKRYFEIKETYKSLSLDYAFLSSKELREQGGRVAEELARAETALAEGEQAVGKLETQVEQAKTEQLTQEQHLAERRRQLGSVVGKLRGAQNEQQLAEQKIQYLSQNRDKLLQQRQRAEEEQTRLTKALAGYQERLHQAEALAVEQKEIQASAKTALDAQHAATTELKSSSKARSQALQQAEQQLLAVDREIALSNSRVEAFEQEMAAQARNALAQDEQLESAQQQAQTERQRFDKARQQLTATEEQEAARVVEEQLLRDQLDQLGPELREVKSNRQLLDNEVSMLQAALDRMEGSSESVKFLANKHGWKGTYPLLSDVLEVEQGYEKALEAVLQGQLHCYVVPTKSIAAEGLRLLSEGGQPVTTILFDEVADFPSGTNEVPAGCRPARDLVKVAQQHRRLLDVLLAGVYVTAESAAVADLREGQVVVDTEGRQVWQPHTAKGGKRNKRQGTTTGRRKKLVELRLQAEASAQEVERLDALRVEQQQRLQQLRASGDERGLRDLRRRVNELERAAVQAEAKFESLQQSIDERATQTSDAKDKLAALKQQAASAKTKRDPLAAVRDAAVLDLQEVETSSESSSESLATLSRAYNEANMEAVKLQNAVESYTREVGFHEQQLSDVKAALAESAEALTSDGSELSTLRNTIDELAARILTGKQARDEQRSALEADEKTYFEQRNRLADWEKELRVQQRGAADNLNLVSRLKERKSEIGYRTQALRDRLEIEFGLALDEAVAEEREVKLSLAELDQKIGKLKGRLDNYGEINPLAVEAYEAMTERHGNIAEQRADILAAMESLRETLAEIDKSATEKLTEAFEAVRSNFVEVFRHLFDAEDTADMVMLDPENPLESKIEIVAKPKGKRPQTISQLSGGEKTLTATAFLFALYLIKPAPFCIFDEVDAPLDDSNVEKFNRIIKRFSGDSQFIIVTHNKLTMAAVDTIYGVYMPELGVSSVAQVDFREFEHSDVLTAVA